MTSLRWGREGGRGDSVCRGVRGGEGVRVWQACGMLPWCRQEEAGRVARLQRGVRVWRGGDPGQVAGGGEVGVAGPGA